MAQFTVESDSSTVDIELTFNFLSSNTWEVVGGDSNVLPYQSRTWNSSGLAKIVNFQSSDDDEFMTLSNINVSMISADRFKNLTVGDSGDVLNASDTFSTWTYSSP